MIASILIGEILNRQHQRITEFGGARRDRTADLLRAKQALSQLSYGPNACPSFAWLRCVSRLETRLASRKKSCATSFEA